MGKAKGKTCFEPGDSAASKGIKGCPTALKQRGWDWMNAGSLCISSDELTLETTCEDEGGHVCTYTEIHQACSQLPTTSSLTGVSSQGYFGDVVGSSHVGTWKISGNDLCAAAELGFDGAAKTRSNQLPFFCCRTAGFFNTLGSSA